MLQKPKKVLSTQSSVFPFEYNKNNPLNDNAFNNWTDYVSKEVAGFSSNCENMLIQANKILKSKLIIKQII